LILYGFVEDFSLNYLMFNIRIPGGKITLVMILQGGFRQSENCSVKITKSHYHYCIKKNLEKKTIP